VVGVANKIDRNSFVDYRSRAQASEIKIFSDLKMIGNSQSQQCTTIAVFNEVAKLFFPVFHISIPKGINTISDKLESIICSIDNNFAPPFALYKKIDIFKHEILSNLSKEMLLKNKILLKTFRTEKSTQSDILNFIDWPLFEVGSLENRVKQLKAKDAIFAHFSNFINVNVRNIYMLMFETIFSRNLSPFHRIDRFPVLCLEIIKHLKGSLDSIIIIIIKRINERLNKFFDPLNSNVDMSKICILIDELGNFWAIYLFEELEFHCSDKLESIKINNNLLFSEDEEFRNGRCNLQRRFFSLQRQKLILENFFKSSNITELIALIDNLDVEFPLDEDLPTAFWNEALTAKAHMQSSDGFKISDKM
jgi:hypothetical protein